jgi:hypothetical protein
MRRTLCLNLVLCACAPLVATACGGMASMAVAERSTSVFDAELREVYGDRERLEYGKTQQVRLPAKLAVADVGSPWSTYDRGQSSTARRVVLQRKLAVDGTCFNDVVSVHEFGEEGQTPPNLAQLRERAARHQADLVLAYECRERVREGHNAAAIFKLLLLPMLFLSTEEDEVELDVRAVVMDARNGLLYTTFDDHGSADVSASAAGEKSAVRGALDTLFQAAVERMREELGRKLSALDRDAATR